jgi:hypothetical protein
MNQIIGVALKKEVNSTPANTTAMPGSVKAYNR